jgi:putative DNA methylase
MRGKAYGNDTYERVYRRNAAIPVHVGEKASSDLAKNFDQLKAEKNTLICCENSEELSFLPDKSVDEVVTDPPYFDNIHYCELADFFYVWLRLGLRKDYDCFEPLYSSRLREIVAKNNSPEELSSFTTRLSNVFTECSRVLKDNAIMVFTFHHTNPKVWIALKNALTTARFSVTAVPIVRSEGRTGYQKAGSISVDACVVCRKSSILNDSNQTRVKLTKRQVITQCALVARKLVKVDRSLKKSDIFTILMGQCLLYDKTVLQEVVDNSEAYTAALAERIDLSDIS